MSEKNVTIEAIPYKNIAIAKGNSKEGKAVIKKEKTLKAEDINSFLNSLREKKISFSFKLKKDGG